MGLAPHTLPMDIRALLSQMSLFCGVSDEALHELAGMTHQRRLASGETLYRAGDPSDALYIVATGRLRIETEGSGVLTDVSRLEAVGEVGVLTNENRGAHVFAVRDTELLCIGRADLIAFLLRHPAALLEFNRLVVRRMRLSERDRVLASSRRPRSFAVLPATPKIDASRFAHSLLDELSQHNSGLLLDARRIDQMLGPGSAQTALQASAAEHRLVSFLHHQETDQHHLVLVADPQPSAWSKRCMRHADHILVVCDAREPPQASAMIDELHRSGVRAPVDVVLLRDDGVAQGRVLQWKAVVGAKAHYFARLGRAADAGLIARSLTGRAIGLVLGGGGARGFAHIGLMRALAEANLPVDVVGGSSMGAFIGALMACGYGWKDVLRLTRETFVDVNLLNDYVLPRVSLLRGRKFVNHLRHLFGDRQVEGLRKPYFCVSTNLTRGGVEVHDHGPLSVWVAASMAVPGVAPPVAYHGELLVDGAVVNALPTDVMQSLQRGPIIASDVSSEGSLAVPGIEGPDPEGLFREVASDQPASRKPTLFSILYRTATVSSEAATSEAARRATLYLRMPVGETGMFDWKLLDQLAEAGYRHAIEQMPAFKARLVAQR